MVVGEARHGDDLLIEMARTHPDLVMLDWELPCSGTAKAGEDSSGRSLVGALRALCPGVAVVALSGRPEARQAAAAAKVDGFVSKGEPPEALLKTLRACGLPSER